MCSCKKIFKYSNPLSLRAVFIFICTILDITLSVYVRYLYVHPGKIYFNFVF